MATQLNFTAKVVDGNTIYEATTSVNADFNVHLERESAGYVFVDVTTIENSKAQRVYASNERDVFDHDFNALVYPKYITITSWSKPTNAKCFITEA